MQRTIIRGLARCFVWLSVWLNALCLGSSLPANPGATFEQANRLYEQGHYKQAAETYKQLLASGIVSPAVYFNLGNAFFKSGQLGMAIISYRLAERLKPRDPDIRANLRFALDSRNTLDSAASWRSRILRAFALDELAVVFTVIYWLWILLLILQLIRPKGWSPPFVKTAGVLTLISACWLLFAASKTLDSDTGVVIVPEAVVRYGPLEESQTFFTLHDGDELTLVGRKDDWWHVRDRRGRTGWVRTVQVRPTAPESLAES